MIVKWLPYRLRYEMETFGYIIFIDDLYCEERRYEFVFDELVEV